MLVCTDSDKSTDDFHDLLELKIQNSPQYSIHMYKPGIGHKLKIIQWCSLLIALL